MLHYIKYHTNSTPIEALRSSSLQAHLTDIAGFASAYKQASDPSQTTQEQSEDKVNDKGHEDGVIEYLRLGRDRSTTLR